MDETVASFTLLLGILTAHGSVWWLVPRLRNGLIALP